MTPTKFPEANGVMGPPEGLVESQCHSISAFRAVIDRGSVEGLPICVVAWRPDARELAEITAGNPVFLTCIGGLPPHFLTTNFAEATNPA